MIVTDACVVAWVGLAVSQEEEVVTLKTVAAVLETVSVPVADDPPDTAVKVRELGLTVTVGVAPPLSCNVTGMVCVDCETPPTTGVK